MKIVFRADASVLIGTGHVMRCLTLATALTNQGSEVDFICREHPGNIINWIEQNGFKVVKLPYSPNDLPINEHRLKHSDWLGSSQQQDAAKCISVLQEIKPDWLIVDHYAIDHVWHKLLKPFCQQLMVIDDIADRKHDCDLLLDQNYGKQPSVYLPLVPAEATLLLGTDYALLRPEFLQWREFSLKRRRNPELKQILITMGGIDVNNVTCRILSALKKCHLPKNVVLKVVMGSASPWLEQVNQQARLMPYTTEVNVGVRNMAEIMANSDIAIGAAGSTSWERCCLGLPTMTVVLAENQTAIAEALQKKGAAILVEQDKLEYLVTALETITEQDFKKMSESSASIVDGLGVKRILDYLIIN